MKKTRQQVIEEKNAARLQRIRDEACQYNASEELSNRYIDVKAVFDKLAEKPEGQQRSAATVRISEIDLSQNDRKVDTECDDFLALKESIQEQGLLQRPVVTLGLSSEKPFLCISGHRRIMAYHALGYDTVPAELIHSPEEQKTRLARLSENLVRQNLSALELAEAVKNLKLDLDTSTAGIARILNRDRKYLTEILKIADWPEKAKELIKMHDLKIGALGKIAKRRMSDDEVVNAIEEMIETKKVGGHPPKKRQGAVSAARKKTLSDVKRHLDDYDSDEKQTIYDFITSTGLVSGKEIDLLK